LASPPSFVHAMGGPQNIDRATRPPSILKCASARTHLTWAKLENQENNGGMEQFFARQLQKEKQERDMAISTAISSLRARFEELNAKVQDLQQGLQQQREQRQVASVATLQSSAVPNALDIQSCEFESATSVTERVKLEVNKFEKRIQSLIDEIKESHVPLSNRGTCLDPAAASGVFAASSESKKVGPGIEGFLDAPEVPAADSFSLLQAGIRGLDCQFRQQQDDISQLRGMLFKVLVGAPMNTIFTTRLALQSIDLTSDERSEALSALERRELEYKSYIHNAQSG